MGSRGDVQPFLSLSIGLINKGHDVALIGPENFKDFVEDYGINFRAISTNTEKTIQTPETLRLLSNGNILKFVRHINKITSETTLRLLQEVVDYSIDCDYLLTSSLAANLVGSIGEKYNKKVGLVFLSMLLTPTNEFPHSVFGSVNFRWFNKISYFLNDIIWLFVKKDVTAFRTKLGLPYRNMMDFFVKSDTLTIYPVSHYLFTQPKDWNSNTHITGFLPGPKNISVESVLKQKTEELEDWLKAGDKPVYIGFGSIPIPKPEKVIDIITEILNTTSDRFVFCIGWSVIPNLPQHKNLFVVSNINHEWLFPLCKVAIIHGGIGTMATVIKSKIPSIVISILADQPYNGKIVEKNKIGVHIPFQNITTKKLLDGIEKTQSDEYIKNAVTLGNKINSEDGLKECIEIIEGYFL